MVQAEGEHCGDALSRVSVIEPGADLTEAGSGLLNGRILGVSRQDERRPPHTATISRSTRMASARRS
jgi:hypothetical protein